MKEKSKLKKYEKNIMRKIILLFIIIFNMINTFSQTPDSCNNFFTSSYYSIIEDSSNCDGTLTVYVNGGTQPYNYLWSNGDTTQIISNLCVGDYSCTTTDSIGCVSISCGHVRIDSIVEQIDTIYATIDTCFNFNYNDVYISLVTIINDSTLNIKWGLANSGYVHYIYVEYPFNGNYGNYYVILTINCDTISKTYSEHITLTPPPKVDENISDINNIKIYPNPVKDILNIEYDNDNTIIEKINIYIYNLHGQKINSFSLNSNVGKNYFKIKTNELNNGIYYIIFKTNRTYKLLKFLK